MKRKSSPKISSHNIWLTILRVLALILTAFTLFYYVLLIAVPYVHPSHLRHISWIGLTMPFVVPLLFIWLILWILARNRKVWITLALFLLCTFPIWRRTIVLNVGGDYPSNDQIAAGTQLRIMTYNVEMFQHYEQADNVTDLISQGGYDIVCLQEYGHYRKKADLWEKVNRRFSEIFPYRHIWFKNQSRNGENGVVLYSRYPIVNKAKVNYDSRFNISVYSDIAVGNDTIRIFNNHLESNRLTYNDRNVADKITDQFDESLYHSFRSVLRKISDASLIRAVQADSVASIAARTTCPVIILGDFNDVPQSYTYNSLIRTRHLGASSSMTDAYAAAGDWFYYYTFNQDHLNVPIDHILVSPEFSVQECSILPIEYSDHYPVSATLLLRPSSH